jgi:signal peptidase II
MSPERGRPTAVILLRRYLFVALLVALDLWSKSAVFAWLTEIDPELVRDSCDHSRGHARYHLLGEGTGWLTFMLSENPGAAFGGFADWPHVLIGLRIVAVVGLLVLIARAKTGSPWFTAALLLVFAGALGNLYDNLLRPATADHPYGKVRDFIDVYFARWNWHFPTFNVADSCITIGAAILLLGSLFKGQEAEAETEVVGPGAVVVAESEPGRDALERPHPAPSGARQASDSTPAST